MGPDDEDLFWIRLHASKIRERDEWEQDTGSFPIHPIHVVMQPPPNSERKKRSLIPSLADGMSKVIRNGARNKQTVVALAIVCGTLIACIYLIYGKR